MDIKGLGQRLAAIGLPLLGAALPLPGGAAIGTALAAMIGSKSTEPDDILATITGSADKLQVAREFEATNHQHLMQMAYDYEIEMRKADTADIGAVNTTMQAEAANSAAEAWYQKAWRPFNGFVVGLGSLFATIAVCVLAYNAIAAKDIAALNAVPVLAGAIALILGVPGAAVGIAAWHRGAMKVEQARAAQQ